MINEKFCPMPFGSMHVDPDGKIYICCSDRGPIVDDNNNVMNVQTHSLKEAWNSKHYQTVRLEFLEGKQPTTCVECWKSEIGNKGTSTRLSAVERFESFADRGYEIQSALEDAAQNNGYIKNFQAVDYQVMSGNLCNLACKMCFPSYSNGWSKFYTSRNIEAKDIFYHSNVEQPMVLFSDFKNEHDWPKKFTINDIFKDLIDGIYFVNLTGGEPTLLPENLIFLESLKLSKNKENLELVVITNTTNINKKLLDTLDGFKKIHIVSSIDGMNEIANIQRSPSNWNQIIKNFYELRKFAEANEKYVSHGVNSVVTALNLHHVGMFWNFLLTQPDLSMHHSMISQAFVVSNKYPVGLEIVPRRVIDKIKKDFQKFSSLKFTALYDNMMAYFDNVQWAEDDTLMLEMLEYVQKLHPDHNIREIYKIYYE